MTDVSSTDPRTGAVVEVVAQESTTADVDRACQDALAAFPALEAAGRGRRADLLRALAEGLESRREDVVGVADRETGLGPIRLNGELTRTCFQLRLFADVLAEGGYLEAAVDHAGDSPMGPRPDLRRMLVPIGPVAVFGASNFPLAFSVPGGDTASALAAGCPVVVKAHHSHPATSQLCFEVLAQAARGAGAPEGTLSLVHGLQAGADLVAHPAVRAVGFTGSLTGGKALVDIIERRPDPVPFYGELSSLNPLIVTPAAAAERGAEVASGLVGSFTLGGGQFCTKPGLALVPSGADGDALVDAMAEAVQAAGPAVLLNESIARAYAATTERLVAAPGVTVAACGGEASGSGFTASPLLLTAESQNLSAELTEECFGPVCLVVRYDDQQALTAALDLMPSSLTATVHRGSGETELPGTIVSALRAKAGRLVYDAYPTGVAVSWAQHHGGPWPSTNSQHTSVGTTAVRRFLRPVSWQGCPEELLPQELRDGFTDIPRRVDGFLVPASASA